MPNEPTNQTLAVMIQGVKELVEAGDRKTHERLDRLNGQVKKNTEQRIQQASNNKWIYGVLTLLVLPACFLVIKNLIASI